MKQLMITGAAFILLMVQSCSSVPKTVRADHTHPLYKPQQANDYPIKEGVKVR